MPAGRGDLELALRIRADLRQAVRELDRLSASVAKTDANTREGAKSTRDMSSAVRRLRVARQAANELDRAARAADRFDREATEAARGGNRLARSVRGVHGAASGLRTAFAAAGVFLVGRQLARGTAEFVRQTDQLTELESRLRLVTDSEEQRERVQRRLLAIAQETRTEYSANAELYARTALAVEHLGITEDETARLVLATNQAIRISGSTAQESTAGVIQFAQGLASGRLAGEELRSVLEQMPRLARAIADGLGVPFGQLRDLAAKGRLDAQSVIDAVLSQADVLEREYGSVERTVGQAATQLRNEFQQLQGRIDEAFGVRERFLSFLDRVREKVKGLFVSEEDQVSDLVANQRAVYEAAVREAERLEEEAAREAAPRTGRRRRGGRGGISPRLLAEQAREVERELARFLEENIEDTVEELQAAFANPPGDTPRQRRGNRERIRRELARAERIRDEQRRLREAEAAAAEADAAPRPAPAVDPKAVEALEAAERELLGTFERQREEARITRDALLARFDEQSEGYADYAARVEAQYQGTLKQVAEDEAADAERRADRVEAARVKEIRAAEQAALVAQRLREAAEREAELAYRSARDARTGAHRALGDIAAEATDAGAQVEAAVTNAFGGMEAAIERLRRTGKANFGDLVDSIIADLTRLILRLQVTGPLALLLQSLLGGAAAGQVGVPLGDGSRFAGFAHGGGIAGALRTGRRLPAGLFAFAPRLHRGGIAGLRDNEVPTILEEGEGVFTPEQMRALGGMAGGPREVVVQIRNESGTEIEARDSTAEFDGLRRLVVGVVVDQVAGGGEIDGALRGAYGVRRQAF